MINIYLSKALKFINMFPRIFNQSVLLTPKSRKIIFRLLFVVVLGKHSLLVFSQENYKPDKLFKVDSTVFINYSTCGTGTKNIIFIPGLGLSHYAWDDIKDGILLDDYRYYFPDMKGFGFSYKSKSGDYSVKEQCKILTKFIQELNLDNVTIVAHSFGGAIALNLMNYNQTDSLHLNISRLILINPAIYTEKLPFFFKALQIPVIRFGGFKILGADWCAKYIVKKTFFDHKKITKDLINRYGYFFRLKNSDDVLGLAANQVVTENYQSYIDSFKNINVPTLIIWGKDDEIFPLEDGIRLSNEIKTSKLKVVENCGHAPHEEWPEITAELLKDFLK